MAPAQVQDASLVVIVASSTFDFSDYRFTAADMHSFMDDYLDLWRHQHIGSRSELYHAETFPAFYSFAAPLPTNNAAGKDSSDLGAGDRQLVTLNYQTVLLVQQARFRFRGHHEFA